MIHYTLNTGHSVEQPRSAIGKEAIEALRPLVEHGGAIPGCAPFRVEVTHGGGAAVFIVWRGGEPIVISALAWTPDGEAEAWSAIEKLYLEISDRRPELVAPGNGSEKPNSLPWLAVVAMPFIPNQSHDDVGWLGDFERCMAWTILGKRGGLPD